MALKVSRTGADTGTMNGMHPDGRHAMTSTIYAHELRDSDQLVPDDELHNGDPRVIRVETAKSSTDVVAVMFADNSITECLKTRRVTIERRADAAEPFVTCEVCGCEPATGITEATDASAECFRCPGCAISTCGCLITATHEQLVAAKAIVDDLTARTAVAPLKALKTVKRDAYQRAERSYRRSQKIEESNRELIAAFGHPVDRDVYGLPVEPTSAVIAGALAAADAQVAREQAPEPILHAVVYGPVSNASGVHHEMVMFNATVTTDADGQRWFQSGSASGPVLELWTVEPIVKGATYRHWSYGPIVVERINRISVTVLDAAGARVKI